MEAGLCRTSMKGSSRLLIFSRSAELKGEVPVLVPQRLAKVLQVRPQEHIAE